MLELSSLSLDTLSLTPRDMGSGVFPSRSVEVCRVVVELSCQVAVEFLLSWPASSASAAVLNCVKARSGRQGEGVKDVSRRFRSPRPTLFHRLGYRAPPIHMLQRLRHNGLPGTELQIHYQPSLSSDTPTPRSCRAHFEKNLSRRRCNT